MESQEGHLPFLKEIPLSFCVKSLCLLMCDCNITFINVFITYAVLKVLNVS
jgi:hypothetical protein